jgi:prenyltransferase beta subunit
VPAVSRGLWYCANTRLEKTDPVDWWAWQLFAMKFSNTPFFNRRAKRIAEFLCSAQKSGHWYTFPSTFNATNFSVVTALSGLGHGPTLEHTINWFSRTKAADGQGWGSDDSAKKSAATFTSNVVLALLAAGADPLSKSLQTARQFLERQQRSGGWTATMMSVTQPTTYSTAFATACIMLLSKNPFNNAVEQGIKFLLNHASKGGGWPLVSGEKPDYYTTFYTLRTLALYKYLKEMMTGDSGKALCSWMEPQRAATFFFREFDNCMAKELQRTIYRRFVGSRALAATKPALKRRIEILNLLAAEGAKDVASIIDALKRQPEYAGLNKRSHITQIKFDIEFMRDTGLVGQIRDEYFIILNPL